MQTFSYVIIDDDNYYCTILEAYLRQYPFLHKAASFVDVSKAKSYLDENAVDILFCDIEMPEMSGLTLVEEYRDRIPYCVFVTSHTEFALDSYELRVNNYVVKPIDAEKVGKIVMHIKEYMETVNKAILYEANSEKETISIKDGYQHRIINIDDVTHLMAIKDYTKVVLSNAESVIIHGNLATTLKNEKFCAFIRIHKSYAVQKKYIKTINTSNVILSNNTTLPMGRVYKKNVKTSLL